MSNKHELIAVKRKWVPEWLFAICAWPIDFVVHQPFRWILTKPVNATNQIAECEVNPREEQCKFCGNMTSDWVDPDWSKGRICRACETKYGPKDQ